MSIRPEHLAALCDLGYTEQEARFVYLVATHAGYFTLQQYLDFSGTTKGWNVHKFTSKAIRFGHLRVASCAYRTAVYNLFSRKVYGVIDRDNLRNRRRLSNDLIHARLLVLDFVLSHPDLDYLETEAEKVSFFKQKLGIPESQLPGRTYEGIEQLSHTKRYFVDRFPIYITQLASGPDSKPVPTFIYCDSARRTLLYYRTHLRHYENLLHRIPAFKFIYAAPTPTKFQSAERFFRRLFDQSSAEKARSITRYFRLRRLWDEDKHHLLTRADRDFLRYGNDRFCDPKMESAYQKWAAQPGNNPLPEALLATLSAAPKPRFGTWILSRDYEVFDVESAHETGTVASGARSESRSDSRSVEENPKHF